MEHIENRDRLVEILESANKVVGPSHFFAWTQGPMQALLPHEILICGMVDGPSQELRLRYFSATRYFKEEHFEAACHPQTGLISQLIGHWKEHRLPCIVPAPDDGVPCCAGWPELMQRLELRNMVAHGQITAQGQLQAWFGFFRVRGLGQESAEVLELLLPYITATYAKMLYHESGGSNQPLNFGGALSRREMQVLELIRCGCSNLEIATSLSISPITAKNHVQNIRVKLKARTRGQAVAEALRLAILQPRNDE